MENITADEPVTITFDSTTTVVAGTYGNVTLEGPGVDQWPEIPEEPEELPEEEPSIVEETSEVQETPAPTPEAAPEATPEVQPEAQTYTDNYIVYLRREDLRAILAPTVQEIYDDCKVFIAPYTPSPDFDKNTTAEELLTTFGMGRNPVVSLWIYTKDDTVGKDTDMQQLTSKIQAMGYSVDVGVYYLSEENYEVVNEDDYLNYNIGAHQDFYEYFENVYIYPDSFELILSDWKEESSK